MQQHSNHRNTRGRKKETRDRNTVGKNNDKKPSKDGEEKTTQVQEAQSPNQKKRKRHTPRHIIIKMPNFKDNERILKAARGKQEVIYKGAQIRLAADFSTETPVQETMASNEKQRPTTTITLPTEALN